VWVQDQQAALPDDEKFEIAEVSFGAIALYTGVALLTYGFGAYFKWLPGESFSAVMLIYGFPASLIGFALKYAELKPIELRSTQTALAMREAEQTDIQKQVREDTTRFRYGDEQHLDFALERIFLIGRPGGISRKTCPVMVGLREETSGGKYSLVVEFKNKQGFDTTSWAQRLPKFQSFFGPGIEARMSPSKRGNYGGMDIALVVDGSGQGRGGGEREGVLPPLLPGLAPRRGEM
jgi:hypothetical protein